jgi:Putative beta-barrel porin-2, OmpL-like. bbp2
VATSRNASPAAQESGGDQRSTSAPEPDQVPNPSATNLAVPRSERGIGGGEPTVREEIQQQEAPAGPPAAPTPLYLNRALGLEDSPVRTYGWIENSFTGNTNGTPKGLSNFSVFPNNLANQWQGNQYYLVVENPIERNDMVNLGFRVDTLFGNDWQFTRSYGLFPNAFTPNQFAGLDLPQIYGEIHLPILSLGGLDIKGGRFYSPAGYSAVPAISRPAISVPYSMEYMPFTFFGALGTFHLTDRVNISSGAINGFDRWIDRSYRWGYLGSATWKSRDEKTNIVLVGASVPDQLPRFAPASATFVPTATTPPSPVLAGQVNPFYATSDRGLLSLVVTRQWTDKLTGVTETDHIWDPRIIGFSLNGKPSSITYHGLVHGFLYTFNDKLVGGWRGEVFWDPYGAATGSRSTFYETAVVLTEKPKPWLWFRGEARFDWSQFTHPFSDGTRSSQLTLAIATIVLF